MTEAGDQHVAVTVCGGAALLALAMMWAHGRRMRRRAGAEANVRVELEPVLRVLRQQWIGTIVMVLVGMGTIMGTYLVTHEARRITWGAGVGLVVLVIGMASFIRREGLLGRLAQSPEPLRYARSRDDGLVFLYSGDVYLGWLRITPAALARAAGHTLPAARIHRS